MDSIFERLNSISTRADVLKEKFHLDFNPFPKSGIASINDSDSVVGKLIPVEDDVTNQILVYITDALAPTLDGREDAYNDKYLSLVVRGEYGSGKTQTLMFIRYLFNSINKGKAKPYVIYIDNPGQKLSELIGAIVAQIGAENFKKYLWGIFISYLEDNTSVKNEIKELCNNITLFSSSEPNPTLGNLKTIQNYKQFIDALTIGLDTTKRKALSQFLKDHIVKSLLPETDSPVVASYFYDIVSETIGISKSWDLLTTGSLKEIDKREVNILKAIVNIVCGQLGYTDFIILIDEFEEITAERLKKTDIDNYLRNLRLLIDREKNWCSVFAMTSKALSIIEEYSAPLAGRIKGRVIDLKPLNESSVKKMLVNYLSTARTKDYDNKYGEVYPFNDSAIKQMLTISDINIHLKGSPRFILKLCYLLLQRASEEINNGEYIDDVFVKKYIKEMLN